MTPRYKPIYENIRSWMAIVLIYLVGIREEGGGRYGGNSFLGEVVEFRSLLVLILLRNHQRVTYFYGQRVVIIDN